jgi:hypothetical protein
MNGVTPFTTRTVEHLIHAKHTAVRVEIATTALLVAILLELEVLRLVRSRTSFALRPFRIAAGVLLVAFSAVVVSRALALR